MLSYDFWRRRFNGDTNVLGTRIVLGGQKVVIVGVLPREFNGLSIDTAPDIRVPIRMFKTLSHFDTPVLDLAGRLRPGVTVTQAQAECEAFWRRLPRAPHLQYELRGGLELDPLEHGTSVLRDRYGVTLKLLLASVGLLLLLVCANVAGQLLARGISRQEIAVRLAVGSSRARLIQQMLTESAVLTIFGAVGGAFIAWALRKPQLNA